MTNDRCCLDCGQQRSVNRNQCGARGLCKSCYYKRRRRGTLHELPKRNHSFEEYLARIVPDGNGCWPWSGPINPLGYGTTGRHGSAHIRSYRHHVGPIPKGLQVGHTCHDNDPTCQDWRVCTHRRCINPEHLALQTRSENVSARPWIKSHCIRGHELSPENVYVIKSTGARQCKPCVRYLRELNKGERNARRRARAQRAALAARQSAQPVPEIPVPRPAHIESNKLQPSQ